MVPAARNMAERVPALPLNAAISAIVDACLSADEHDWVVLLDDAGRPVRLVQRAALLRAEEYEFRVVTVPDVSSLDAVARAAMARPRPAQLRPLVCCDDDGRFYGLLRMERLLESLAAERAID